ncbi:related to sexual differentiation process protein isp4 [Rhynchosporium secalis]|uniref:Related to sexual differentiation process protein isp4 n=1 Tax=Rhynchosporium secalis TaxID=38038 RepID=A0A1E1MC54_RHYSE|nr:related to sexual differentiation process protein isp4 [Rhynchosporium secalis]
MASRLFRRFQSQNKQEKTENSDPITPVPLFEGDAVLFDQKANDAKHHGVEIGDEKIVPGGSSGSAEDSSSIGDDDPTIRDIPINVRRIVSLEDDPTLPTITFRYFVLCLLFIIPGAFLSQMSHYRTTYAPYSVFFVQIASNYVGIWLATVLPAWNVRVPFTSYGFNMNPGPFGVKEHVLVTISAASGATYNLAYAPVSIAELYFGEKIHPAIAVFFMYAVVITGYSFAAISRQFLLYDPQYPWFQALCQTALFETQKKQREQPSPASRKQMMTFWIVLLGITLWQFLPEFVFPMLGSLAFLCWVAPRNATANFIGAGFGGMGFLNLSFDWSNVSSLGNSGSLFLTPFWTQVLIFLAFATNCWILIPAAKWGSLGGSYKHGLMSNHVLTANGTRYPLLKLLTPQATLNETAYEINGPLYLGAQVRWGMFFDYASYTSALVWMALFGFSQIKATIKKLRARNKSKSGESINFQYNDRLNIIQRSYPEVPLWWYIVLFLVSFVAITAMVASGHLFIPWWTYLVALLTGALIVTPLGWLYAISNFQLAIGTTNELFYGLMINAVSGHKNPTGATVYSSIAGDAWYRAQYMLQDQKIGHFMHIPPRATFFSQIFGATLGIPINYAVIRWVIDSKFDYLTGQKEDPSHQWTGQSLAGSLATSVQYVLVGPQKLFQEPLFKALPYGFLAGVIAPMIIFALHKTFPNSKLKFRLWNTTIFFSCLSGFYGNISTGYTSQFIGSFIVMYWAFRYRYNLWAKYNYILAAAFDAGFNFNMLLIFLFFGSGKVTTMPFWWGNREGSSERCFALDS